MQRVEDAHRHGGEHRLRAAEGLDQVQYRLRIRQVHRAAQVVVPKRRERRAVHLHGARGALPHRTNSRQRQPLEFVRHTDARRRREQQFVVLPAMQRLFERRPAIHRRRRNLRAQSRRRAQAVQIEREPVAQVHRRRGTQPGAQKPPQRQARLRPFMPQPCLAAPRRQSQRRPAERTRDIDRVAGARPVAPQRLPARHGPRHHDVAHHPIGPRQIAADQRRPGTPGQRQQPVIETVQPSRIHPTGQRQREQTEARLAAHRRDIAEPARQRLPADIRARCAFRAESACLRSAYRWCRASLRAAPRGRTMAQSSPMPKHHARRSRQRHPAPQFRDQFRFVHTASLYERCLTIPLPSERIPYAVGPCPTSTVVCAAPQGTANNDQEIGT